jgi:hypothetical protein
MRAAIFRNGEIVVDELPEPAPGAVAQAFSDLANPEAYTKIIVEPWR